MLVPVEGKKSRLVPANDITSAFTNANRSTNTRVWVANRVILMIYKNPNHFHKKL